MLRVLTASGCLCTYPVVTNGDGAIRQSGAIAVLIAAIRGGFGIGVALVVDTCPLGAWIVIVTVIIYLTASGRGVEDGLAQLVFTDIEGTEIAIIAVIVLQAAPFVILPDKLAA